MARNLCCRNNTEVTRALLRAAIRKAKNTAKRVQEEHWLDYCASLGHRISVSVLWRKVRSVSRGEMARPALHPLPMEEAEFLADTFASRAATARLPPDTQARQREVVLLI